MEKLEVEMERYNWDYLRDIAYYMGMDERELLNELVHDAVTDLVRHYKRVRENAKVKEVYPG